ncbi:MAG: hypothetical protein RTU63_05415 [Candidatus Thorarchaeota archaeon]
MTRNTPEILPYCQHCGSYKGVGTCKNPKCDKSKQVDIKALRYESSRCTICSTEGSISCSRCGGFYCNEHAIGSEETKLMSNEQHLGTCVVCGAVICERCWIFNNNGSVTCLVHLESKNNE